MLNAVHTVKNIYLYFFPLLLKMYICILKTLNNPLKPFLSSLERLFVYKIDYL